MRGAMTHEQDTVSFVFLLLKFRFISFCLLLNLDVNCIDFSSLIVKKNLDEI